MQERLGNGRPDRILTKQAAMASDKRISIGLNGIALPRKTPKILDNTDPKLLRFQH
ncbi:hypothetical protein [Paraburkholderia youngii]|uniref:hypothetical protein n=1 Tax=Paraburkholderia youngii TaxID=2782701 RepID=UPI003D1BE65A